MIEKQSTAHHCAGKGKCDNQNESKVGRVHDASPPVNNRNGRFAHRRSIEERISCAFACANMASRARSKREQSHFGNKLPGKPSF
jgi:hypothetical protein